MLIAHIGTAEEVGQPKIIANGDLRGLVAEVCLLVSTIKCRLAVADEDAADAFAFAIRKVAADGKSPMWTTSIDGEGISIVSPSKED